MAARWRQAKELKIKRMRRAYLKSYSMKNTGPAPYAVCFNDQGKPVDMTLGGRNRAAQHSFDLHDDDRNRLKRLNNPHNRLIQEVFGRSKNAEDHRPEVIYARRAGLHSDLLVLAKLNQSDRLTGEQTFSPLSLMNNEFEKWTAFFCSDEAFVIREIIRGGDRRLRKSISYGSLARVKQLYLKGKILFVEQDIIIPASES